MVEKSQNVLWEKKSARPSKAVGNCFLSCGHSFLHGFLLSFKSPSWWSWVLVSRQLESPWQAYLEKAGVHQSHRSDRSSSDPRRVLFPSY